MKKFSLSVGILVVLVVAFSLWRASLPDAVVTLIQPRVQTIRAYVEEQAVTELPTDHLIAMPIAGRLEPIDLREGDVVEKGQTLARFDTEDLQDRLQQAEHQIAVLAPQRGLFEQRNHAARHRIAEPHGEAGGPRPRRLPLVQQAAQEAVIRDAMASANVTPADIGYVEAHGTGTPIGDPADLIALGNVFRSDRSSEDPVVVEIGIAHV